MDITPAQQREIDKLREWWINRQTDQSSLADVTDAVSAMWASMGHGAPTVLQAPSPYAAVSWAAVLQTENPADAGRLLGTLPGEASIAKRTLSKMTKIGPIVRAKAKLPKELQELVRRQPRYYSAWWQCWAAWYEGATILGVKFDEADYNLFRQWCLHVPFLVPYETLAVVSQWPVEVYWQDERLHRDGGPAMLFRDGWAIYSLNGIRVPEWLAVTPADEIPVSKYAKLTNAEHRREFVRKVGIDRVFYKHAKILDSSDRSPGGHYELGEIAVIDGRPRVYLKMENQSLPGTFHLEPVHPACRTVQQALNYRRYGRINKDDATWTPNVVT